MKLKELFVKQEDKPTVAVSTPQEPQPTQKPASNTRGSGITLSELVKKQQEPRKTDPSVMDKMKGMSLNIPETSLTSVTPQVETPVPEPVKVESVVEQAPMEVPAPAPIVEAPTEIPTNIEVKTPVEKTEEAPKQTPIEMTDTEKGRVFVEAFLGDVDTYLKAGSELTDLMTKRKVGQDEANAQKQEINQLIEGGEQIKSAIETLLSTVNEPNAADALTKAIEAFNGYRSVVLENKQKIESEGLRTSNEALLKINGQKTNLEKITYALGGKENIENVLKYVRKAEMVAARFNERQGNQIQNIRGEILKFVKSDLHIAKDFAGRGDMLSILQSMFSNKPE